MVMRNVRSPSWPLTAVAFGPRLRARRTDTNISLSRLSELTHYSKSYLSKIENGAKAPTFELARRCDAALGTDGELAALVPPVPLPQAEAGRDTLVSLPGLEGAVGMVISIPAAPNPRGLEDEDSADRLAAAFRIVRSLGRSVSAAVLLPFAASLTHASTDLARSAPSSTYPGLLGVAAQASEYTGWMAQEAGDDPGALSWTTQALRLAEAAGDPLLADYAPIRMALISLYRQDAQRTIALAGAVRKRPAVHPRTRVMAGLREAQGHALAGNERACLAALDRARKLNDHAEAVGLDTPFGPAAPGLADLVSGWCLYDLGRLEEASDHLMLGLGCLPSDARRSRARFAVRLALATVAGCGC